MKRFITTFSTDFIFLKIFYLNLILCTNVILGSDPNGLLRSSGTSNKGWVERLNATSDLVQIANAISSSMLTTLDEFNTSYPQVLNLDDNPDLEPDTNKTKRSKVAIRWLKQAIGLGSGNTSPTSESESEMSEESQQGDSDSTTPTPSSGLLSKLNPLNKVSSKVSFVTNTAGRVYQKIAGKVGLGSSGGGNGESGPGESNAEDSDDNTPSAGNPGVKDDFDDEGSGGGMLMYNIIILIICVSVAFK